MSAAIPVGIDLGTTFSAAARINSQGRSEMIANSIGDVLTPSVVAFDESSVQIGRSAWEAAEANPDLVAEHAKRDMGQLFFREMIRGQQYPPEVIQSCILRELRRDIRAAVGEDFRTVITVPAYYDELRRKTTADAGTMSGLEVLDIVNEPTAAALAFGERLGYLDPQGAPRDCLNLLVYDLGGGTFDVTVIQLAAGQVRTLATDGDVELGGVNWDQRLAEHAEQRFRKLWSDAGEFTPTELVRLRRAAEQTKIRLSQAPLATLEFHAQGKQLTLPVTADEYYELTQDLLERTCFTTREAVRAAGLLWQDIDRLLLVGGSTRMPMVRRALTDLSGMQPDDHVDPDQAVARGAAIFAHNLLSLQDLSAPGPKLEITDVIAHGLGIAGVNQQTLRKENAILIPRNTQLPHEVCRTFVTKEHNQRSVKVQLLEGESSIPEQCSELAAAAIRNLPIGLPAGTKINVWYSFQSNGRLAVRAEVPGVGDHAEIELERVRGIADEGVAQWKKILGRDGGYRDFEEALAYFLDKGDLDEPKVLPPSSKHSGQPVSRVVHFEPAIDSGAPQAAADHLNKSFSPVNRETSSTSLDEPSSRYALRSRKGLPWWGHFLGHALASTIGLTIGYYILCWIRPEANFLELNLPGLPR
ncbi:MAG: Hsp70 family protein [Pirellulales bacterium]